MLVIERIALMVIFAFIALIIVNVIIPWMYPGIPYWWTFRRNKIGAAQREQTEVAEDVLAGTIQQQTAKLRNLKGTPPEKQPTAKEEKE